MVQMDEIKLDCRLIESCNNVSQHNAGSVLANSAQAEFSQFDDIFGKMKNLNQTQIDYIAKRREEYRALLTQAYTEHLRRRADIVPVNVAGPSNYPHQKMQKKSDKAFSVQFEYNAKQEKFIENTHKGIEKLKTLKQILTDIEHGRHVEIHSDDPNVLVLLQKKLEVKQQKQERMKTINAYYRKHKTLDGCEGLTEKNKNTFILAMSASIEQDKVFPTYMLTNNNSEIKRLKSRIESLTKSKETSKFYDFEFDGGNVVANHGMCRLQILFDEKPDEPMRAKLKSNGFKWSPNQMAWQRLLTDNAFYVAKSLFTQKKEGLIYDYNDKV